MLNVVIQSLRQLVAASLVSPERKDHDTALLQSRADALEEAEFGSSSMGEGEVQTMLDTPEEMADTARLP